MSNSHPSEDEEQESGGHGKPNDYWRRVREESGSDTFGGSFRGTPAAPRKKELPPDTIGSEEFCWCGEPLGHDWPGKASGVRHPRKETSVSAVATERVNRIDPLILRAYDEDIAEVIKMAVNQYGCRYKVAKNSITVWGLNKSARPITFGTNSGGFDVKKARSWIAKNVIGLDVEKGKIVNPMVKDHDVIIEDVERRVTKQVMEEVEEEALAKLAETLNSPEHPAPSPAEIAKRKRPAQPVEEPVEEWVPLVLPRGLNWTGLYEVNTVTKEVRCTRCDWTAESARGVSGHDRTVHRKEETRQTLWENPEANAKKADTSRYNNLRAKVTEAIDLIADLVDYSGDSTKISQLEEKNATLQAEVERLRAECADASTWKAKAEDAEARLALLREALDS